MAKPLHREEPRLGEAERRAPGYPRGCRRRKGVVPATRVALSLEQASVAHAHTSPAEGERDVTPGVQQTGKGRDIYRHVSFSHLQQASPAALGREFPVTLALTPTWGWCSVTGRDDEAQASSWPRSPALSPTCCLQDLKRSPQ